MTTNHNITGALPGDITIPSPYFFTILSATLYTTSTRFSKISKDVGILPA
jgi:hypothetical protein